MREVTAVEIFFMATVFTIILWMLTSQMPLHDIVFGGVTCGLLTTGVLTFGAHMIALLGGRR